MKKLLLPILVVSTLAFGAAQEPKVLKVDPSAQAKADKQMKLQNKNVIKFVIEEYKRKLPQKVDNYTQFVDISSKDLTLIYTFEINTGAKSDETVIKEDKKRMGEMVKLGICKSSQRFLDSDINLSYVYNSQATKKELFKFNVTKKDCSNI